MNYHSFLNCGGAQYLLKEKYVCVKIPLNSNIVVLQGWCGIHIIFYKLKKTSLFGSDPFKSHIIIKMFFSENLNNYVKINFSFNGENHMTFAVSFQKSQLHIFSKLCNPT